MEAGQWRKERKNAILCPNMTVEEIAKSDEFRSVVEVMSVEAHTVLERRCWFLPQFNPQTPKSCFFRFFLQNALDF